MTRWICQPQSASALPMSPDMKGCGHIWADEQEPVICPACGNHLSNIVKAPALRTRKADRRPDYVIAAEELSALMVRERLDVTSTFVPFSQSRNKAEKYPSLNWRVTLQHQGRDANTGERAGPVHEIMTTDYMAGSGHCPAYKRPLPSGALPVPAQREKQAAIAFECETGFRAQQGHAIPWRKGPSIEPNPVDVFSSLLLDAGVLNAGGFEEWASDYGYDTDSRKAEETYKACLETALKLRSALGDKVMAEAQDLANRL